MTTDKEFSSNYDRVATEFKRIRLELLKARGEQLEWQTIVDYAMNCKTLQMLESEVGFRFFKEYFYRDNIPSKSGIRGRQHEMFDLDEVCVVDGKALPQRFWDIPFMDALREQKTQNIDTAQYALELFEFERDAILPFLRRHPKWRYIDAYDAIIKRDGKFPDPPKRKKRS